MIASSQQGLSRRGAERCGVEAIEFEALGSEEFRRWSIAWTTEGGGGTKARVVNQDDQDVGRTFRREQRRDLRVLRLRVLGVVGDEALARLIRDWKHGSLKVVLVIHGGDFLLVRNQGGSRG